MINAGDFKMNISAASAEVMGKLCLAGYECYAVGGCVRDEAMGRVAGDYDLTTNALPEQMEAVFEGYHLIETGLKHGTLTIHLYGENVEVTTFRIDGSYSDSRRPDTVEFTCNLVSDLERRDFTVNAMAWSDKSGLCDPFGGMRDIDDKIIRCVGSPDKRFGEDALRILRALRFSSVLNFSIHPDTSESIHRNELSLEKISNERIFAELKKLICGNGAQRIMLEYSDVFCRIIPELEACIGFDQKNKYHCYDVYRHIAETVKNCEPIPEVRLAALFHDIAKPLVCTEDENGVRHFYGHEKLSAEIAGKVLRRLKCDNATLRTVTLLIEYHDRRIPAEKRAVKRLLAHMSGKQLKLLQKLRYGDIMAHAEMFRNGFETLDEISALADKIIAEKDCFSTQQLKINGSELMQALSIPAGPEIGKILTSLTESVINEEIENEKPALINKARSLIGDTHA